MRTRVCVGCGKSDLIRLDNKSEQCRSCATKKQHERFPANLKHGWSSTRMYNMWLQMKQRCENPDNPEYTAYGGRGIKVCDRWQDFEKFMQDMGTKPFGWHIHRIDNDKGYEPDNCEYVSAYKHRQIHKGT